MNKEIKTILRKEFEVGTSHEKLSAPYFDVLVVGGGPGGLGTVVALLNEMEEKGKSLSFHITDPIGLGGTIGFNKITANSSAADFIEDMDKTTFKNVVEHNAFRRLKMIMDESANMAPKLSEVGDFYREALGQELEQLVEGDPFSKQKVEFVVTTQNGHYAFDSNGKVISKSKYVVFATGANEKLHEALMPLKEKVIFTREVFMEKQVEKIEKAIEKINKKGGKITVVGNSHGAWAAVYKIIKDYGDKLPAGSVEVAGRRPTKVFFDTVQEAAEADYLVTDGAVCPKTGRVNRFGGIRNDAKQIYLDFLAGKEPRISVRDYTSLDELSKNMKDAQIIVQSVGLATAYVPIFNGNGEYIGPQTDTAGQVQMTPEAQLIGKNGEVILGIYGNGVGYDGIKPTAELGGEPDYKGSLHGANVYRMLVGPIIAKQIVK